MATSQYTVISALAQTAQKSHTTIILSNGEWVAVPEGADPDAFRKVQEARLRLAATGGKPRRASHSRTDNGSRRNRQVRPVFAGDIIGHATARRMDELKANPQDTWQGCEPTIRLECAWCGIFLGGDPNGEIISHGICEPCKEAQLAELVEQTFASGPEWDIPFDGSPQPYEAERHPIFEYAISEGW